MRPLCFKEPRIALRREVKACFTSAGNKYGTLLTVSTYDCRSKLIWLARIPLFNAEYHPSARGKKLNIFCRFQRPAHNVFSKSQMFRNCLFSISVISLFLSFILLWFPLSIPDPVRFQGLFSRIRSFFMRFTFFLQTFMLIDFYASPYRAKQPLSINSACPPSLLRHTRSRQARKFSFPPFQTSDWVCMVSLDYWPCMPVLIYYLGKHAILILLFMIIAMTLEINFILFCRLNALFACPILGTLWC